MIAWADDRRIVLVLDAGGTSFRFNAAQGGRLLLDEPIVRPSFGHDLPKSLAAITDGFAEVHAKTGKAAVAISFAFPGPADYTRGIIGDLPNLPGYRGGVALGPMLTARFGLPAFINNDGALFAYGEALGGLLPFVNHQLAAAGSARRYANLLGITLGTGFGGGLVIDGRLVIGDNAAAGQIWSLRHRDDRGAIAEEGVSIRAVRTSYTQLAGATLEPHQIAEIANGTAPGDTGAAREAFRRLGQVAGDAIASALSLFDGLVVIGGGISGAAPWFRPALVEELNATLESISGPVRRLAITALDLDEPAGLAALLAAETTAITVPGTTQTVPYAPHKLTGVGLSRLGTTAAIALGAYAYALERL